MGHHFGATEPELWSKWSETEAQRLLMESVEHGGQRYAAARGIAFCGQITTGDTWHGYPVLWRDVPDSVRKELVAAGQMTPHELSRGMRAQRGVVPRRDVAWGLDSDGR